MTSQRTLHLTAALAAAGGAAWLTKMIVIAATDGAVDGAADATAGVFYLLGVVLLAAGASAVTLRLARGRGRLAAAAAIVASPVLFWSSYMVLESIAQAVVGDAGPTWFGDEVGILLTGAVWLGIGVGAIRAARSR